MGRDTIYHQNIILTYSFNPHAPMGRDVTTLQSTLFYFLVSIHTPLWGATQARKTEIGFHVFQSTRPYGARLCLVAIKGKPFWFQSTRPYGARHLVQARKSLFHSFNPHAPMGRDIGGEGNSRKEIQVSIHTPLWGATDKIRN